MEIIKIDLKEIAFDCVDLKELEWTANYLMKSE
jgi:hypothetical protein